MEKSLSDFSDEKIYEEAASRLLMQYSREHTTSFMYGTFRFVIHEGRLQCIEEWPRNRTYLSPSRNILKR